MTQRGIKGVRAAWQDATEALARQVEIVDPNPAEKRHGYAPGQWPGAPSAKLPPGCPVVPLGIDGKVSYFIDTSGQLIPVSASEWGKKILTQLFAMTPNYLYWAWPRFSAKTLAINGLEVDEAHACLVKAAAAKGLFNPADQVRGRGAWTDRAGRLIWHSGEALWQVEKGKLRATRAGEIEGVFYPRRPSVLEPWREPVEPSESPAHELLAAFRTWTWERPHLDPILLVGWLGCAFLGGALPWRPTVFVTGDKGVGKSKMQSIVKAILGHALHSSADTTAAGIYQRVKQDSLPVAVDELEAGADNRRQMAVINLARLAASGAMMFRGGAEHEGVEFRACNAFFFSSINPPPLAPQDKSRMAILNLGRLDMSKIRSTPLVIDADNWGRMILRSLMDAWPRFDKTLQDWRQALFGAGLDSRAQDTYGTLLAVADLMLGHEALEEAGLPVTDAGRLGETIAAATAAERAEQSENWRDCLEHLLGSPIEAWKGGEKPTVGGVVQELEDRTLELRYARERLAAAGLGLCDRGHVCEGYALAIPPKSPQLAKMFAGQVWAGGVWTSALKQGPPDVVIRDQGNKQVVKINRIAQRCLLVNLEAYDALVKRANE